MLSPPRRVGPQPRSARISAILKTFDGSNPSSAWKATVNQTYLICNICTNVRLDRIGKTPMFDYGSVRFRSFPLIDPAINRGIRHDQRL